MWADKLIFWPLLLYRQLRYGYAFRKIRLSKGKYAIVDKDKHKWRASIHIGNKLKFLGYFEDEKKAAVAYDTAAKEHRGEYAFLNFGRVHPQRPLAPSSL